MKRTKRVVSTQQEELPLEGQEKTKRTKRFLTSGQEFDVITWILAHEGDIPLHTTEELCQIFEQEHGFAITNQQLRRLAGEKGVSFDDVKLRRPGSMSAKTKERLDEQDKIIESLTQTIEAQNEMFDRLHGRVSILEDVILKGN